MSYVILSRRINETLVIGDNQYRLTVLSVEKDEDPKAIRLALEEITPDRTDKEPGYDQVVQAEAG